MKNNIQTPDAITAEGWRLQTETAALEYAARGFAVIPLHSPHGGKCSCGKAACKATGKARGKAVNTPLDSLDK